MVQHAYNDGPIESRMWSTERRHFQWPWTTCEVMDVFQGHAILTLNISETLRYTDIVSVVY